MRKRRQFAGKRLRKPAQSQVFSETYKAGTECAGVNAQGEVFINAGSQGQGIKLIAQMNRLSQVGDYKNLQRAYKVLKVKYTIIPKWSGEAYNEAAIGTAGAIGIIETPRFAQSVNDMDENPNAPLTETEVLQANGCRVKMFRNVTKVAHRPTPLLETTGGSAPQLVNTWQPKSNPWIEFDGAGTSVQHVGVAGYFSAQNSLTAGFASIADVQTTITFVCKDPR